MDKHFDGFWGFFGLDPHEKFKNNQIHFDGLKNRETAAIQFLELKTDRAARWILSQLNLPIIELQDIRQEALMIFLDKIAAEKYTFSGSAPSTFFVEIFRNVSLNKSRSKYHKKPALSIENSLFQLEDTDFANLQIQREDAQLIDQLLEKLGDPCEQIIRLRHLDGFEDEEVIEKKMTKYATADSLKVKRSNCMKKLREIAAGTNYF
jgi:RNA polymerase sigma factor (sigma-70 family)